MNIKDWLDWIEADRDVRIIYAVEAGSRAWGIQSPDSDFDVRFIYVRPRDAYLQMNRPKDTIEHSVGDLDFQGWDITKTCQLAHKSNPSLLEWLTTDQIYLERAATADKLRRATQNFNARSLMHHYVSLANHTWKAYLENSDKPHKPLLKKYFYAVRPVLCLLYMRQHEYAFPPLNFETLCRTVEFDVLTDRENAWVLEELEELLTRKRNSGEKQGRARYPWLDELICRVIYVKGRDWATEAPGQHPDPNLLDVICQDTINGFNKTP